MDSSTVFVLARALHIVAVVLWIGGVGFVTMVLIPAIRQLPSVEQRLKLFEVLEGRFAWQVKVTTTLTLLSGLYMIDALQAWDRYLHWQYWWMHLMTLIWLVFALVLFVLEPLFLHRWFRSLAQSNSNRAFSNLHVMHKVLLSLSLLAVLGAVSGSHGLAFLTG